jgi:hypothetical protein
MRHLLGFFVLGALLLGAKGALETQLARRPAALQSLTVRVKADASHAERERAIDEAVLIEEALRMNGAWIDPVVREQLLSTMRGRAQREVTPSGGTLAPRVDVRAAPGRDDDASLIAHAVELGLHQADVVTRQRLVFQAEQLLTASAATAEVGDDALQAYLQQHRERYAQPERLSFRQVFVSRARHADRLEAHAEALRAQLERAALAGSWEPAGGDPSLLPRQLEGADAASIEARFGAGFAQAVAAAELGRWSAPVASAYGLHLVWPLEHIAARVPTLAELRARVLADYRHDLRRRTLTERLRDLRARYRIELRTPRS